MRGIRAVIGITFVVIGSLAVLDGDFDDTRWWIIAAGVAVAGLLGLVSAFRS